MTEEEQRGPEMTRLLDRLYGDPDPRKRVKNFRLTPGPNYKNSSVEEIAKMINASLDEIASGRAREIESFDD